MVKRGDRVWRRGAHLRIALGVTAMVVLLSGCPNALGNSEPGRPEAEPVEPGRPEAEPVTYEPAGGVYGSDIEVELTSGTAGAAIYYTLDGSAPDTGSAQYSGPIPLNDHGTTATIRAIAVANDHGTSAPREATFTIDYLSDLSYTEMVPVPAGDFWQEEFVGFVDTFTHNISAFELGMYEVTYDLWYTVRVWAEENGYVFEHLGRQGNNDNRGDGSAPNSGRYEPVTMVSWYDSIAWANAYSEMAGLTPVYYLPNGDPVRSSITSDPDYLDDLVGVEERWDASDGFRLPSEGEWNYAATYIDGHSQTDYNYASGATSTTDAGIDRVAWFGDSADTAGGSRPVGRKDPNQLGLYDMSGNVEEWVWDWRAGYPSGTRTNYRGPAGGSGRAYRGGTFLDADRDIWVSNRKNGRGPQSEWFTLGLRVARTP
ncbi:MAG: SUMF1/EgtB/PvdO family nonheme iron enzyme [Spirochaetaceae bacterium]